MERTAWPFRIAQNVVADTAWKHRAARRGLSLDNADRIVDPGFALEDRAVARNQLDAIRDALTRLPSDQREMVELQIAGLATQEIASSGKSPGAVRMLRLRAFQHLRPVLAATGHAPKTIGRLMSERHLDQAHMLDSYSAQLRQNPQRGLRKHLPLSWLISHGRSSVARH